MQNMYKINHFFFSDIDSEIKAYLLGFYLGDGCVTNRGKRGCEFKVSVSEIDMEIMNYLTTFICKKQLSYPPKQILEQNNKTYYCKQKIVFGINSKQIVEDLTNFGYGPRKTYLKKSLPKIDESLIRHFIRGYFDADGTCVANLSIDRGNQWGLSAKRTFRIVSYDKNILDEIQILFKNNNIVTNIYPSNTRNVHNIATGNLENINKLYNYLYDNANFYLIRKKKSFELTMLTSSELRKLKNSKPCNA